LGQPLIAQLATLRAIGKGRLTTASRDASPSTGVRRAGASST